MAKIVIPILIPGSVTVQGIPKKIISITRNAIGTEKEGKQFEWFRRLDIIFKTKNTKKNGKATP